MNLQQKLNATDRTIVLSNHNSANALQNAAVYVINRFAVDGISEYFGFGAMKTAA